MKSKIILNISQLFTRATMVGLIATALSFFIPIVPCTKSPVIAEPVYKLGFCKLPNPFAEQILGVSTKYYGINLDPLAGAILQFILISTLAFFIFNGLKKK